VVLVEVTVVLGLIYIALEVRRVDEVVVKGARESLKGSREVCLNPTSSSI
jgi:hypothetical protein